MSDKKEEKSEIVRLTESMPLTDIFSDMLGFQNAMRIANCLAKSTLVPVAYQNDVANCTIALEMSQRLKTSPLMVMQNLVIIHGKPSWSATFIIGLVNTQSEFDKLRFKFDEDRQGCYAWAKDADGEVVSGTKITIAMSKAENWFDKKGSKWKTMPEQMLQYRAATFFARLHCPELLLGLSTSDELVDIATEPNYEVIEPEVNIEEKIKEEANTTVVDFDKSEVIDVEVKIVEEVVKEETEIVEDDDIPECFK